MAEQRGPSRRPGTSPVEVQEVSSTDAASVVSSLSATLVAHPRDAYTFFIADGYEDGGYGVACSSPGISGRWVRGRTLEEAYQNWQALFDAGELNES